MDGSHRDFVKDAIQKELEGTLEARVDRFLSIGHQPIVGDHYFADASSECIKLFRDGYYIACIALTQSVTEGIVKFACDRNAISQLQGETRQDLVSRMNGLGLLSANFVSACSRIRASFRNDFHHMNPKVAEIPIEPLARRNIADLAVLELEIFDFTTNEGKLVPRNPRYWDVNENGHVPAYLRLA